MVFVNGYAPDIPAPFVSCDDRHAAALAVRHLASLGHRRIGFVSGPRRYVVVERKLAGYRDALAGGRRRRSTTTWSSTRSSRSRAGGPRPAPLVERGATAVVAASDLIALGTILGAASTGSEYPATGRPSASTTPP